MLFGSFCVSLAIDDVEMIEKEINSTDNVTQKGILYKKLGDSYSLTGNYQEAARAYRKALSLARDSLTIEEKIHIAKVLSWSGRYSEAIEEADSVLEVLPEDKSPLLIKANALRWKGNVVKAIPLYKKILERGEDFDARLGLSYAFLTNGNFKGARENLTLLKPENAYQKGELNTFEKDISKETSPHFDLRYSYFNDSDDNRYNRYSFAYNFLLQNMKINLNYRYTDAWDTDRNNDAHELFFNTYSMMTDLIGIGGGLGFAWMDDADFVTWHIKSDFRFLEGKVGAEVSRNALAETAQLIENGIRVTNTHAYISQNLTDRISLYGSYTYKDFSDSNSAHDFQFIPRYSLTLQNPRINIGYKLRYLDFNRHSGGGYFDPQNFLSHQVFSSLYYEKGNTYVYIEPFFGHQSFTRFEENNHDYFGGAYGVFGYRFPNGALLEANAEGGNYALETASGFRFFLLGAKLIIPFPL
jgi:tetratricopeptide (TPR) repeat protein